MVMAFSDFNGILYLLRLHRSLLPSFTHKKVVNHSIKGDFVKGGSVDSANVKIIVDLLCVKSWERRGRERDALHSTPTSLALKKRPKKLPLVRAYFA